MNEVNHAVLDSLREFFNRVDSSSVRPIGVKDFIGWCNEPCDYYPKSSKSDSAYKLGKTICALEELSDDKIDGIKEVLEAVTISVIGDINVPSKEQKGKLFDKARSDLLKYDEIHSELEKHLGVYHGELSKTSKKDLPENVAFYCALKSRLKSCPNEQGYYHYQFDDNGNTIARVDPLKPFVDSTHDNLNQQWHVLISVLAYLDVAHALSNDHHECHYLYPYLSSYDKGNLNKMRLKLKSTLSLEATPEIGKPINYPSEAMVAWIKDTLVRREGK